MGSAEIGARGFPWIGRFPRWMLSTQWTAALRMHVSKNVPQSFLASVHMPPNVPPQGPPQEVRSRAGECCLDGEDDRSPGPAPALHQRAEAPSRTAITLGGAMHHYHLAPASGRAARA